MFKTLSACLAAALLLTMFIPATSAQVVVSGRNNASISLQSAAAATGYGSTMSVAGMGSVGFLVTGSSPVGTITFEATQDPAAATTDSSWVALAVSVSTAPTTLVTTTTAVGTFTGNVGTFKLVRARVSAYTSGTWTIKGSTNAIPYQLLTAASNPTIAAGSAIIGVVTTDQTTHGTTDLVAADLTKVGGVTLLRGNGVTGTGSQRVTIASDNTPFPVLSSGSVADGAAKTNGVQVSGQDGTNVESVWTGSAANVAGSNPGLHTLQVTGPGEWAVNHVPSTATQATISKAAGAAGVRHVCTSITATVSLGATAQTPLIVYLRDGATGAGTILWAATIAGIADGEGMVTISGLHVYGTAATAMTLEFAAAGVTASQEIVSMTGYDTI